MCSLPVGPLAGIKDFRHCGVGETHGLYGPSEWKHSSGLGRCDAESSEWGTHWVATLTMRTVALVRLWVFSQALLMLTMLPEIASGTCSHSCEGLEVLVLQLVSDANPDYAHFLVYSYTVLTAAFGLGVGRWVGKAQVC